MSCVCTCTQNNTVKWRSSPEFWVIRTGFSVLVCVCAVSEGVGGGDSVRLVMRREPPHTTHPHHTHMHIHTMHMYMYMHTMHMYMHVWSPHDPSVHQHTQGQRMDKTFASFSPSHNTTSKLHYVSVLHALLYSKGQFL